MVCVCIYKEYTHIHIYSAVQAAPGQALGRRSGKRSGRQCEALGQGMAGQREALRALGM